MTGKLVPLEGEEIRRLIASAVEASASERHGPKIGALSASRTYIVRGLRHPTTRRLGPDRQ